MVNLSAPHNITDAFLSASTVKKSTAASIMDSNMVRHLQIEGSKVSFTLALIIPECLHVQSTGMKRVGVHPRTMVEIPEMRPRVKPLETNTMNDKALVGEK